MKGKNTRKRKTSLQHKIKESLKICKDVELTGWEKHGSFVGKGSFGTVYRLDKYQQIVVKIVDFDRKKDPSLISYYRQEFIRESYLCGKLSFPSIIKTYGYTIPSGFTHGCLLMKYYPSNITKFTESHYNKSYSLQKTIHMISLLWIQIIAGIHYLHLKGLIYLDMKPDNILCDTKGRVYLTDFGLSKCIGNSNICQKCISHDICRTPTHPLNCSTSSSGTKSYYSYAQSYQKRQSKNFGYTSDYWTACCVLWGLLPAKDKKYLSKSPFRTNHLPEHDRRGFDHILSYIRENHTPKGYFYGAEDEMRMDCLQKYREFNQVFNYIFSKKFAQNMFKCQTGESTNTLAKKMIKPFLSYGWNTQEINTIFTNMKKNPDGYRFDFMTHRL